MLPVSGGGIILFNRSEASIHEVSLGGKVSNVTKMQVVGPSAEAHAVGLSTEAHAVGPSAEAHAVGPRAEAHAVEPKAEALFRRICFHLAACEKEDPVAVQSSTAHAHTCPRYTLIQLSPGLWPSFARAQRQSDMSMGEKAGRLAAQRCSRASRQSRAGM